MEKSIKLIFFGNGPYALEAFKKLVQLKAEITTVITSKHDKDISKLASINDIGVVRFEKEWDLIKEELAKVDYALVASFGVIIPDEILQIPNYGFFNIHPSLLPRHRGPAPVIAEIFSEDEKGGVSVIKLDEKMDHGPLLAQQIVSSTPEETAHEIYKKRFQVGSQILVESIPKYISEGIELKEQDHTKATYSKKLDKSDGFIDLSKQYSTKKLVKMIRAYTPWPRVYFDWIDKNGKKIRIYIEEAVSVPKESLVNITDRLFSEQKQLYLNTGDETNILQIKKLGIAGKNSMDAGSFINGYLK